MSLLGDHIDAFVGAPARASRSGLRIKTLRRALPFTDIVQKILKTVHISFYSDDWTQKRQSSFFYRFANLSPMARSTVRLFFSSIFSPVLVLGIGTSYVNTGRNATSNRIDGYGILLRPRLQAFSL